MTSRIHRARHPVARAARGAAALGVAALFLALPGCGGDATGPTFEVKRAEVSLSAGESQVVGTDDKILELTLPSASEGRDYRIAVQSASQSVGSTPIRLVVEGLGEAAGSVAASAEALHRSRIGRDLERRIRESELRHRLKRDALRELQEWNARPARRQGGPGRLRTSLLPSEPPSEGELLSIRYPVNDDLTTTCDTTEADTVVARVQAVGQQAVMVEDTSVSDAASAEMDYDSLAQVFDQTIFGTNTAYFGEPTDIDSNGKVLVLFTPEVNKLSEQGGDTFIAGFFVPIDLADSGGNDPDKSGTTASGVCPASNEAELLYLLAPDPIGQFGDTVSVQTAVLNATGTSAHEFQHLLNTGNRVIKQDGALSTADLEATWLDEGLSHIAEEVVGFSATGDPVQENLTFGDVTESRQEIDEFNAFHFSNFARLQSYFQAPGETQALALEDPSGTESLRMRGFAWIFLRWLADQTTDASGAPPQSGEESLFRDLAKANEDGLSSGIDNVEEATGRNWSDLIADFGPMPLVDDQGSNVPNRFQNTTWNLRNVFSGLSQNQGSMEAFPEEFPLAVADLTTVGGTSFSVQAGTQEYFRLTTQGSTPETVLRLTNQANEPLTAGDVRVIIVRVQ